MEKSTKLDRKSVNVNISRFWHHFIILNRSFNEDYITTILLSADSKTGLQYKYNPKINILRDFLEFQLHFFILNRSFRDDYINDILLSADS
jgi:hypothetical protein